jgi:hypothetical protein
MSPPMVSGPQGGDGALVRARATRERLCRHRPASEPAMSAPRKDQNLRDRPGDVSLALDVARSSRVRRTKVARTTR